eukprot:INCI14364.1.p1 GENE.INCI14364.1~~INCI14364.1.p1  ORF type:complete len:781 (+),score=131.08 INCI14364.1:116-2458(+)
MMDGESSTLIHGSTPEFAVLVKTINRLSAAGRYGEAVTACGEFLASTTSGATISPQQQVRQKLEVQVLQAGSLAKLYRWVEVERVLDSLPRAFLLDNVDALVLKGLAALAANRVPDAVRAFQAVLKKDPRQPLARTSLLAIEAQVAQQSRSLEPSARSNSNAGAVNSSAAPETRNAGAVDRSSAKILNSLSTGGATARVGAARATENAPASADARTPVVIVSGFLGAGKTTFLNHVLENRGGLRAAVVVNDMASVNVDAALVTQSVQQGIKSQRQQAVQHASTTSSSSVSKFDCGPELANHNTVEPNAADTADLPEVLELTNGCVCCTLRDDLARQLVDIATRRAPMGHPRAGEKLFDYIFVECTGISEPLPVAQVFLLPLQTSSSQVDHDHSDCDSTHSHGHGHGISAPDIHRSTQGSTFTDDHVPSQPKAATAKPNARAHARIRTLSDVAYVDALVSLVDARHFWSDFASKQRLRDRAMQAGPGDNRAIVELLTVQVEYANVVVINKCDLVSSSKVHELRAFLARLNPTAALINSTFSAVPLDRVLFTHAFNFETTVRAPGWLRDLVGDHESETDAFGFTSWVFCSDRPFCARRFHNFASGRRGNAGDGGGQAVSARNNAADARRSSVFAGVLRSKGHFALAEEPRARWIWSSSFSSRSVRRAGAVSVNQGQRSASVERLDPVATSPSDRGRSPAVELVFIGIRMNEPALREVLNQALATDAEIARMQGMERPAAHPWLHVSGAATPTSVVASSVLATAATAAASSAPPATEDGQPTP